ncbi:protein ULTRAPETALA 1-like [Solanum lycopersicum]|uniref:SAND domain-containing protein n=1 Tax=Solanum lycopersicum TaxID=4081 RepID=K4DCG3_SOLLC|nr:protein ULTRAPETALA 1-like [Solanum lycopersicum]XP_004251796.1 protein ULTRAPETALA 1-like [Solanum lycopersicum]
MFCEEELRDMSVLQKGDDYVEVVCGCTSRRHGDAGARLRIFKSGELKIACECYHGCPEDNLSPFAFEKHAGKENNRWKHNIWVFIDGYKVPLIKTTLLKFYNMSPKNAKRPHKLVLHRDEFIKCTKCSKRRRFYRRSKNECRSYHDALANANFQCSDIPFDKFSCDDAEERASRRACKGCLLSPTCGGCTSCVCFGCEVCCFSDCDCQTCIDFRKNTKA